MLSDVARRDGLFTHERLMARDDSHGRRTAAARPAVRSPKARSPIRQPLRVREETPAAPARPFPKARAATGAAAPPADQSQKLQKVLAQAGLGSRREMEEVIRTGKVLVNGEPATIGTRVSPEDVVKVGRRQIRFKLSSQLPRVIIYHKPEGEIVSRSDPDGRPSVFDHLPAIRSGKWLAIGRLDFNTCGLLIFTTSGELSNRLTHPRFEIEREYAVRVMGEVTREQAAAFTNGVKLEDGVARFEVFDEQGGTGSNRWYRVVVREGRNRLVRRMFEHFGIQVSRLMRTRFGMINMPPRLKRGQHLELTDAQTKKVLEWLASGTGTTPDMPPAEKITPPKASPNAPAKAPRGAGGRARSEARPAAGRGPRPAKAPGARTRSETPRAGGAAAPVKARRPKPR